jgi:hypothetical protein
VREGSVGVGRERGSLGDVDMREGGVRVVKRGRTTSTGGDRGGAALVAGRKVDGVKDSRWRIDRSETFFPLKGGIAG